MINILIWIAKYHLYITDEEFMDSGIMVFIIVLAIHNLSIDKYLEYAKYRLSDEE